MISVPFQGKPFNTTVIQVYAPTSNPEEAEVEWFYEDLQDLLELTPKKDVLFIIGDWNAKVRFCSRSAFKGLLWVLAINSGSCSLIVLVKGEVGEGGWYRG